jgi:hypothetical protein
MYQAYLADPDPDGEQARTVRSLEVAEHKHEVEVFYLPSYSPDSTPTIWSTRT